MMDSPFSRRHSLRDSPRSSRQSPRKSLTAASKPTTPSRLYLRQSFSILTTPISQQPQQDHDQGGQARARIQDVVATDDEQDYTHVSTTPKDDPPLFLSSSARAMAPATLAAERNPVFKMPAALRQRSVTPSVRGGSGGGGEKQSSTRPIGNNNNNNNNRSAGGLLNMLKNRSAHPPPALTAVLRTTETEYDVSPNRSVRLLATPQSVLQESTVGRSSNSNNNNNNNNNSSSNIIGSTTPSRSRQRDLLISSNPRSPLPLSSFPRSPLAKYSSTLSPLTHRPKSSLQQQQQYTTINNGAPSSQATLDWIQKTANESETDAESVAVAAAAMSGDDQDDHGVDLRYLEQDHPHQYGEHDDIQYSRPEDLQVYTVSTAHMEASEPHEGDQHHQHHERDDHYHDDKHDDHYHHDVALPEEEVDAEDYETEYPRRRQRPQKQRETLAKGSTEEEWVDEDEYEYEGNGHEEDREEDARVDRRISRGSTRQEVDEAGAHLLEVAESTTSITSQLRGVYANLQEFFSPETEAKLHDAITVLGSQQQQDQDQPLVAATAATTRASALHKSMSAVSGRTKAAAVVTGHHGLRSNLAKSVMTRQHASSGSSSSSKPKKETTTKPVPFNFSERLERLQRKYSPRLGASVSSSFSSSVHPSFPSSSTRGVQQQQQQPSGPRNGRVVQGKQRAQDRFLVSDGSTLTANSRAVARAGHQGGKYEHEDHDHHNHHHHHPPPSSLGASRQGLVPLALRKKQLERTMAMDHLGHNGSTAKKPLTEPKSPQLQTKARAKPIVGLSYEDRVLQDIEAARGQLKANIVNRRIFDSVGDMGVPKLPKIPLTVPKSPAFTKRKPAPLRSAIMGHAHLPPPPPRPPLMATSVRPQQQQLQQQRQPPRLRRPEIKEQGLVSSAESAKRLREKQQQQERQERQERQRHHRSSHPGVDHPEEEGFEEEGEEEAAHVEDEVEEEEEEEGVNQGHHADEQLRHHDHHDHQRRRAPPAASAAAASGVRRTAATTTTPMALTVPQPFHLETEVRGEMHRQHFQRKLHQWKAMEHAQRIQQRAATATATATTTATYGRRLPPMQYHSHHHHHHHPPSTAHRGGSNGGVSGSRGVGFKATASTFFPQKSTKPLTVAEEVPLRTDRRVEARRAYEQELRQKEKLVQEMLAERAREEEHREQQELRTSRQHTMFHANPIRHYPPIAIHRSDKPLTVPRSPLIGDKRKWRSGERSIEGSGTGGAASSSPLARFKRSRYGHEQTARHHAHEHRQSEELEQEDVMEEEAEDDEEELVMPYRRPMGRKSWLEANDL